MALLEKYLIRFSWWSLKKIYRVMIIAAVGVLLVAALLFSLYVSSLPPLSIWHTTVLKEEFTDTSPVKNIGQYMQLEDQLFLSLQSKIYQKVEPSMQSYTNRYTPESISIPSRWKPNWNRSLEFIPDNPKGGVLLLHGMSDSPYSLHTQATYLFEEGYRVLALRMPGHGTIPSGLRDMKWEDMAAVVQLGMQHLSHKLGDKPIFMMGYSTGAALALHYTLKALNAKEDVRVPDKLIFYSPAIGVSAIAPLAVWQSRIGHLLGLSKLEWNTVLPEYDPFKYGSFAVNAGDQVYRLTQEVQKELDRLNQNNLQKHFPPLLSFQSIVDSTVSVSAVIDKLYAKLPKGDHALVLFDINHHFDQNNIMKDSVLKEIAALRERNLTENYTFEVITNLYTQNNQVERIVNHQRVETLPYMWTKGLYSLSHLSMPISPDDPLYGNEDAPPSPGIQLGHLAIYGETGLLQVPPSMLLRQRWNPFQPYIQQRVLEFLKEF